jgi:hypothetical protein
MHEGRRRYGVLSLLLVVALLVSAVAADTASAKYTRAQRHAIAKKLYRAVKKNPRVITKRWFLKKASQVNYTLPATVRLIPCKGQGSPCQKADNNDLTHLNNNATLDLGPSLGSRTIGLGGSLNANINFNDAFESGHLGDVKLSLAPGGNVTTTAVPLLTNTNTSNPATAAPTNEIEYAILAFPYSGTFEISNNGGTNTATASAAGLGSVGGDVAFAGALQTSLQSYPSPVSGGTLSINGVYVYASPYTNASIGCTTLGGPGSCTAISMTFGGKDSNGTDLNAVNVPNFSPSAGYTAATTLVPPPTPFVVNGTTGSLDADGQGGCGNFPGNGTSFDIDYLNQVTNSRNAGNNNNEGPGPFSLDPSATASDVVLRTSALNVSVDNPGTYQVPADSTNNGFGGTGVDSLTVGASGGRANLFGFPVNGLGSGNTVDVTVNLATNINTIARQVDGQWPEPAGGGNANEINGNISAYFNCRQAWTGTTPAHLSGVHLTGNLRISPALTADGKVRIAKVSLASPYSTKESLAACLMPYQLYMAGNPFSGDAPYANGNPATDVGPNLLSAPLAALMDGTGSFNPLVALTGSGIGSSPAPGAACNSGGGPLNRGPFNVSPFGGGTSLSNILTTGAAVAVSGDLKVNRLRAEVLIGANQ